jgi:hypothetical protein
MKRLFVILGVAIFFIMGFVTFPPSSEARNNTCTIKATKDVNLQAHYSDGGRKAPSIRSKSDVIWSGYLPRGGVVSVSSDNGWVHLAYQDMTNRDPRSENNDAICQNSRVILVPR